MIQGPRDQREVLFLRSYEVMYILHPTLEKEKVEELIQKFSSLVEKSHGKVEKINRWGRKNFAYPIKGEKRGFYVVMNFKGTPETASQLDNSLRLSDAVLRHLLIRVDEER